MKKEVLILIPLVLLSLGYIIYEYNFSSDKQLDSMVQEVALANKARNVSVENSPSIGGKNKEELSFKNNSKLVKNIDQNPDSTSLDSLKILETTKLNFSKDLASRFTSLKRAADSGDLEAAYILGQTLQDCAYEPRTMDQYNEAISKNFGTPISVADVGYELCKGITDKQLTESTFYLELAANGDDIISKIAFFKATPLEIENYSDDYSPQSKKEKDYLDSLFTRKIKNLDAAVTGGSIDAAITLGLAYSDDMSPTITGYNAEKALEYLILATLMDPSDKSNITAYIEFLKDKLPVYLYEKAFLETNQKFAEQNEGKIFTLLN